MNKDEIDKFFVLKISNNGKKVGQWGRCLTHHEETFISLNKQPLRKYVKIRKKRAREVFPVETNLVVTALIVCFKIRKYA